MFPSIARVTGCVYPRQGHGSVAPLLHIYSKQHNGSQFGSVRFGSVRFGSVRFGSVRFGSARFGSIYAF